MPTREPDRPRSHVPVPSALGHGRSGRGLPRPPRRPTGAAHGGRVPPRPRRPHGAPRSTAGRCEPRTRSRRGWPTCGPAGWRRARSPARGRGRTHLLPPPRRCSACARTTRPPTSTSRAGGDKLPRSLSLGEVERLIAAANGTTPRSIPRPRARRAALRRRPARERGGRPRAGRASTSRPRSSAASARATRSASSRSDARPSRRCAATCRAAARTSTAATGRSSS